MSERLKQFLSAYLKWVESGAKEEEPFSRRRGLCSNFEDWLWERKETVGQVQFENSQLFDLFRSDGLDSVYPFGGAEAFYDAMDSETQHLNQARIDWVRSKVAQHEVA
jgi:hypothetical protein